MNVLERAIRSSLRARLPALALTLACASGCTLKTDVAVTGAAPSNVSHLYLTVNEVWLGTESDTPVESGSGWNKHALATPVTVDLATLTPGTLAALATQLTTAGGTYRQVHLATADSGDALVSSAQAQGLASNSQLTITAANGTTTTAPLESAVPGAGLTIVSDLALNGTLTLDSSSSSAGTTGSASGTNSTATPGATLALALDGARDILPYSYAGASGYILSPASAALDEKDAGAISGTVDASALAAGSGPISVSAELSDPTGSHHVIVQRRLIASDGSFTLYPLPAPRSGTTAYDLVIAGAGAETVIVRGIPVAAGSAQSPVVAQSSAVVLTAAATAYADIAQQAAILPAGARVAFYQTVPGSGQVPYAIDGSAIDLKSRRLPGDAFALGTGPLQVGDYARGNPVTLSTLSPLEGNGGYVVGSEGLYRADTLAVTPVLISGTQGAPTPIAAPFPAIAAGGISGDVRVTLSAPLGTYDSGLLIIAAGNRVVEAADVGAILFGGGGTITLTRIPSGSALAPNAGVPYQVSLRAWNSANASSLVRVAAASSVPMGNAGSGSVALQLP